MTPIELIVTKLVDQTPDVRAYELASRDGAPLPPFEPGSHLDLFLGNGLVRQYSLCNGPGNDGQYVIGVKREQASRGGSQWMHDTLVEGDLIRASPPKNNFPLVADAPSYVLLAGGIGITPILSMARHLMARGARFALHYFVRSDEHVAFRDLLEPIAKQGYLSIHAGLAPDDTRARLVQVLGEINPGAQLYMCGPGVFMDLACACAHDAGWPKSNVHLERFSAGADAPSTEGGEFTVRLVRAGKRFVVPCDQTIAAVLAANGVEVPVSCEQGVCGTCVTDVVSGTPDHRDVYLTDDEREEGKKICVCVSRSRSPLLELDL